MINPAEDGVTHINIYSKGATELGRLLTNFAYTPFNHDIFGQFASVEGFWYFVKTGFKHDHLRDLHGVAAKKEGKQLEAAHFPYFQQAILSAIRCKMRQPKLLQLLAESTLPFEHYYYGTPDNAKVIELPQYQWIVDEFERIRSLLHARK